MDEFFPQEEVARAKEAAAALLAYCRGRGWAGFDPYDALNSRAFARTPFSRSGFFRILFTQAMKRLPVNLRPLLSVPREQNPKALALFASALVKLEGQGLLQEEGEARPLVERLIELRSSPSPYFCWGYNFAWQNRVELVPRFAPNIICTTFAANALLDVFGRHPEPRYLEMAESAGRFLVSGLNIAREDGGLCFSYTESDHSQVHNANFLGAALLSRLYALTGEKPFLDYAMGAARFSARRQRADGSWLYGELPTQRWIDNFHTGYNLCALRAIARNAGTDEFDGHLRRGFEFYRERFFRADGAPRYFHDRTYPIDVHNVAQSIITLLALRDLGAGSVALARSVFGWAMANMRGEEGSFYYQSLPLHRNKISYMRWGQAWMLLALATLLEHCGGREGSDEK
ncbi:MAG: exopolysaccharide biosynthesis protein VpsJ [Thermodesulfovibrionales bacterium]